MLRRSSEPLCGLRLMGHTILDFTKGQEIFDDLDLWLMRHFLLQTLNVELEAQDTEHKTNLDSLKDFIQGWDWQGPGVYLGTNVSEYLENSPSRLTFFLEILEKAKSYVSDSRNICLTKLFG